MFASSLINLANKQIGYKELCRYFNLKPHPIYLNDSIQKEFNLTVFPGQIQEYLQKGIAFFAWDSLSRDRFWPEDIDFAEKYLDNKYPEIRQLYRLAYSKESKIYQTINQRNVERMFNVFIDTCADIYNVARKMFSKCALYFIENGHREYCCQSDSLEYIPR